MAFAITYAFWGIGAGLSIRTALAVGLVVFAVGLWGLLLVKFLTPSIIKSGEEALWVIGPCLGVGALALLVLRLLMPIEIFLGLFVLVPTIHLVLAAPGIYRDWAAHGVATPELSKFTLQALTLISLSGICLQNQWTWTMPVSIVAFGIAIAWSSSKIRAARSALPSWIAMIGLISIVADRRSGTWWMAAEGIPFDETILETFSKGLISYGPSVNALHNNLSGLPAIAYHHLVYLVIGLADYFSYASEYRVLVVASPPFLALSLIASLILFTRRLMSCEVEANEIPGIVATGLIACLLSFQMFGSPSSWLGVVSVVASFTIIASVSTGCVGWREIAITTTSLIVVAFSKGTSLFAPSIAATLLPLFNLRQQWKIAVSGVTTFVVVVVFFGVISKDVASFQIQFWPYRNLASKFQFDFYTLKVFVRTLLVPVIAGIASSIFLLLHSRGYVRRWSLILTLILWSGVISQLLVTSTGPRSFEAFYVPAVSAAGLLLLVLSVEIAISKRDKPRLNLRLLATCGLGYWLASLLVTKDETGSINFLSLSSGILIVGGVLALAPPLLRRPKRTSKVSAAALLAVCFLISLTAHGLRTQYKDFHEISKLNSYRFLSDWYGGKELQELSEFMKKNTTTSDLFAVSICNPELDQFCQPDFRIAALSGRKFLALHPLFSKEDVDERTWSDVAISRSIGAKDPASTFRALEARGATHLIIERSRVSDEWTDSLSKQGPNLIFENSKFSLYQLRNG